MLVPDTPPCESVGHEGSAEEYPVDRLNSPFGCAYLMVWAWVGAALWGAVVIGVVNILRLVRQ